MRTSSFSLSYVLLTILNHRRSPEIQSFRYYLFCSVLSFPQFGILQYIKQLQKVRWSEIQKPHYAPSWQSTKAREADLYVGLSLQELNPAVLVSGPYQRHWMTTCISEPIYFHVYMKRLNVSIILIKHQVLLGITASHRPPFKFNARDGKQEAADQNIAQNGIRTSQKSSHIILHTKRVTA